jgi:acetyl-CoA synthetase (ADP-forming)
MKILNEHESKKMLEDAGIKTTTAFIAKTQKEAVDTAKKIGFPVVLKVLSPELTHKSDAGGVKLNLADENAVKKAYDEIVSSAKKVGVTPQGVTVQKMAPPGTELIVGINKDPQFGHVIMFGLGGIFVEIFKDVSLRIVPITERDADEMLNEIKGLPLLKGYRGRPPSDIQKIKDVLLRVSDLTSKHQEIKEMDINPLFAYPNDVLAVDARVILE